MGITKRSNKRKVEKSSLPIPLKVSKILNLFFFALLIIVARLWQLCIVQHEEKTQEVLKPRQKIFMQQSTRGGVYDRFGEPLAVNKIFYNVGIFYAPIRQIPSIEYKKGLKGKKIKSYPRREYIERLSCVLGSILNKDPKRIEDLIHAKASIMFDTPYILEEGVSEKQYHHLKILENQWPGIYADMASKRHYPEHKVASHILGYMGAINLNEYEAINQEKYNLRQYLKEWEMGYFPPLPKSLNSVKDVRQKYKELSDRRYGIYDWVGKSGIEAKFDSELRGYFGQKVCYSDAKGDFLRPLASSQESLSGKKITLTISKELQEYAENLLIENDRIREGRSIKIDPTNGSYVYQKQPWIKGGAIVVMDPNSGEVLALASYPRFDPNDFISIGNKELKKEQNKKITQWLETPDYVKDLWNGSQLLTKENFFRQSSKSFIEEQPLSWQRYLQFVLAKNSPVAELFNEMKSINDAVDIQKAFEGLLSLSNQDNSFKLLKVLYSKAPHKAYPNDAISRSAKNNILESLAKDPLTCELNKRILEPYFSRLDQNYDKLLFVDLCRLSIDYQTCSDQLKNFTSNISLNQHRDHERAYFQLISTLKSMSKELYNQLHFKDWREKNQRSFLKQKRKDEFENKRYPKPFIDYLDQEEAKQFEIFFSDYYPLLLEAFLTADFSASDNSKLISYLDHFALWAKEIDQGAHKSVKWIDSYKMIQKLFETWPKNVAFDYLQTLRSFDDLNRPLLGQYKGLYPLKGAQEKDLAKVFYPKNGYSFSRSYAYSQATPQGSLFKLVTAYEALRQNYQNDPQKFLQNPNPLTIVDDLHLDPTKKSWNVGFTQNGKPIPQLYKGGRLPRSHKRGIGKLSLIDAITVTSNIYFSLLSSDVIKKPEDLNKAAFDFSFGHKTNIDLTGEISGSLPKDLENSKTALYSYAIGHHTLVVTPLQSTLMMCAIANKGRVFTPQIIHSLQGVSLNQYQVAHLEKDRYDFKEPLSLLGIDYPFFCYKERGELSSEELFNSKVKRMLEMPDAVQKELFKGMREVVHNPKGTASITRVRSYPAYHPVYQAYDEMKDYMIGKTSSAEIREFIDLDLKKGINTYKHVWFASIVLDDKVAKLKEAHPELVVVVYLRYGDFGREAAPIAAAMAKKWREIKKKHISD